MDRRAKKDTRGGPENITERIGKRLTVSGQIRKAYQESGLSIQALCDATLANKRDKASGLPYQSVWRWVRKDRVSSVRTLDAIAEALGLEVVKK
jgi:hypothetical protein